MDIGTWITLFYDVLWLFSSNSFYRLYTYIHIYVFYPFATVRTLHMTLKCNILLVCLWSLNINFWVAFLKLQFFSLFSRWKDYPTNKFLFIILYIYYWVDSQKPCVLFSMISLNSRTSFTFFFQWLCFKPLSFNLHNLLVLQIVYTSLLRERYCMFQNETK